MTDSDTESENETHSAGECSCASAEKWIEDNVSWKLEDFTGTSGITTEFHEMTGLISGSDFFWAGCLSNLYHQQNEKPYKKCSKALKWTNVANSDMKKFPGK